MTTPISLEFFPPKTDEQKATLEAALPKLKALKPEYVSCTFGAGGSTLAYTPETIRHLRDEHGLDAAPHVSCMGGTQAEIRALLEQYKVMGCRRIVAVSTQHVHLPRPGVYGRTKRIADAIFLGSGLDVTVLRPSLVYGAGGQGVFAKIAALAAKLPVIPVVGPGQWHLRPVWVEDLNAVILSALAKPETVGRTYDVGGRERVTYDEMLAAICRTLGKPCRPLHLPIPLCFVLAWFLERLLPNPPLTTENVHGALVEAPCDLSALDRDLKPAITPFAEGLRQTLGRAA